MRALASYIMRGRLQALVVAVIAGGLTWVIPPVSIVLGAVIALVTLRQGALEGLLLVIAASGVTAALGAAGAQNGTVALAFVTMMVVTVLPVWLLAIVLRRTISLPRTIAFAAGLGALAVVAFHAVTGGDPAGWWSEVFTALVEQGGGAAALGVEPEVVSGLIARLSAWMTGMMAAGLVIGFLMSLFLGRWWQALLYNPDGFRQEFHGLRLEPSLALATAVAVGLAFAVPGTLGQIAADLLWVAGAVYLLPGLGIVHSWLAGTAHATLGLAVVYVLVAIIPHVAVLLELLGWLDTWVNIRGRLRRS